MSLDADHDVLTTDDPLYTELYDVTNEAKALGNWVDVSEIMPQLHKLRASAPVHKGRVRELLGLGQHTRHIRAEGRQHYSALSYEACEAGFRDPKTFSNSVQGHDDPRIKYGLGILEMDPPIHRAYRRTLQPKFLMPEAMGWWRKRTIDNIVRRLIERLAKNDRAELNIDFCARIPVYTITTAIGLDGDEALRFRHAYMNSTSQRQGVAMEDRIKNAMIVEETLMGLINARRAAPQEDLVSFLLDTMLMIPGEDARPLSDLEIAAYCKLVMVAGGGTSWRQIGITLLALLTHPDQFAEVKADRKLLGDAIEEGLRWNPTAPYFYRMVMQDTHFYGHDIPAGSVLELCLGPANRDPARWANADAFDLHRPKLTNMAFGLGTHRCLGMNVARVEIETGINALLDAFPKLRLDPDAEAPFITGGLEQQGPSGLPVLLK